MEGSNLTKVSVEDNDNGDDTAVKSVDLMDSIVEADAIPSGDVEEYKIYMDLFPPTEDGQTVNLKLDNIDFLIINAVKDMAAAKQFGENIEKLTCTICDATVRPRVALLHAISNNNPFSLNLAFTRSQFILLFITEAFNNDWKTLVSGRSCLMEAIERKKNQVIPVLAYSQANGCQLPFEIKHLPKNLHYSNRENKYDALEQIRHILVENSYKYTKRKMNLHKRRQNYFQKNREEILSNYDYMRNKNDCSVQRSHEGAICASKTQAVLSLLATSQKYSFPGKTCNKASPAALNSHSSDETPFNSLIYSQNYPGRDHSIEIDGSQPQSSTWAEGNGGSTQISHLSFPNPKDIQPALCGRRDHGASADIQSVSPGRRDQCASADIQPALCGIGDQYASADIQPALCGRRDQGASADIQSVSPGRRDQCASADIQPALCGIGDQYASADIQPALCGRRDQGASADIQPALCGRRDQGASADIQSALCGRKDQGASADIQSTSSGTGDQRASRGQNRENCHQKNRKTKRKKCFLWACLTQSDESSEESPEEQSLYIEPIDCQYSPVDEQCAQNVQTVALLEEKSNFYESIENV